MTKKKCYISGAITGYDAVDRKAAFSTASNEMTALGLKPVNPFENGQPQPGDIRKHMKVDIGLLLQCDYIYMLRGWWLSANARLELDVAAACGIRPIFQEDSLTNEEKHCSNCGKKFYGSGHAAVPGRNDGKLLCDSCHMVDVAFAHDNY